MKYLLMRRNDKVALIDVDFTKVARDKNPLTILEIIDNSKLPFSVMFSDDKSKELWLFLLKRIIPVSRVGYDSLLKNLYVDNICKTALYQNFLSLNDQYWVCEDKTVISRWEDINYFENEYSYDIGNIAFGYEAEGAEASGPDLLTQGRLIKTWRQVKSTTSVFEEDEAEVDFNNYLLKLGSPKYYQESYNEVLSSEIASKIIKTPVVHYSLKIIKGRAASMCKSFLDEKTMLVTAEDICKTMVRESGVHIYAHLKTCCSKLGIKNYEEEFGSMLYLDYIIGNTDRHLNNMGFLYDTAANKWKGFAPIFDNGASLWYNMNDSQMAINTDIVSPEKLKLIKHLKNYFKESDLLELKNILIESDIYKTYNPRRSILLNMALNGRIEQVIREINKEIDEREKHKQRKREGAIR